MRFHGDTTPARQTSTTGEEGAASRAELARDSGGLENLPVVVPIAAVEQHGRHCRSSPTVCCWGRSWDCCPAAGRPKSSGLPCSGWGTRTIISTSPARCRRRRRTYLDLLGDLIDNLVAHGFRRIVLLNGHFVTWTSKASRARADRPLDRPHRLLLTANTTASGRETRRASSDPACNGWGGIGSSFREGPAGQERAYARVAKPVPMCVGTVSTTS